MVFRNYCSTYMHGGFFVCVSQFVVPTKASGIVLSSVLCTAWKAFANEGPYDSYVRFLAQVNSSMYDGLLASSIGCVALIYPKFVHYQPNIEVFLSFIRINPKKGLFCAIWRHGYVGGSCSGTLRRRRMHLGDRVKWVYPPGSSLWSSQV